MSRISFQDPIDDLGDRTPYMRSRETSPKHDVFPPYNPSPENKQMTKLERLLRSSDIRVPNKRYSELISPKIQRQKLKLASPRSMRQKLKDPFESEDFVFDPLCHKGLINLLKGLEKKIGDLGILKSKSRGATSLALIRTKLKMRRKSDVSQWSGGVSTLEKESAMLNYEYIPAIAVFDSGIKKESASPMLKNVFDTMMSIRNKNLEASLTPEKKESSGSATSNSSTITIVAPDMSLKVCHMKDTVSLAIEDDINIKKGQASRADNVKDLLKTMGFGTNLGLKTRVVIVDIGKLKDLAEFIAETQAPSTKPNEIPSQRGSGSRNELSKRPSEPLTSKGAVELKLPPKNRRIKKIFTVHEQAGSPTIETHNFRSLETSQDVRTPLKTADYKPDEDKEVSRLLKNVRIQNLSRKKLELAHILNPQSKAEKKSTVESYKSLDNKLNSHFDTQITETVTQENAKKKKPARPKGKRKLKASKTFGGNFKLEVNKSLQIQQIYNNNNLKQPAIKPKVKEDHEETKKQFKHRKYFSSTYTSALLSPKLSPKKQRMALFRENTDKICLI